MNVFSPSAVTTRKTGAPPVPFETSVRVPGRGRLKLDWKAEAATKIEHLTITGPEGDIEALLEWDPEWQPREVALVCHPHPLYGGTMHNKVVFRAAKAAAHLDVPALRFNFRGVGRSAGKYADGIGERDDARAALDYLSERFPNIPVTMMGFSFGSVVALAVGSEDERVNSLVGIGLPVDSTDFSFLRSVLKPKLLVQGTEDQFGSRQRIEKLFASLSEPKRLRFVEGADHFLTGRLHELQTAIQEFLRGILNPLQYSYSRRSS
ncbi:MAG TPA: alpha/beta fold hydrolase [Terriglobia bacterium]|nr:alpha/beta fold hydrolase [Terriglobia bacterium]